MENKKVVRKLNKKRVILSILILIVIIILVMIFIVGYNLGAKDKNGKNITFTIAEKQVGSTIINNLEKKGVIRSAFWFKVYMKLNGDINFVPGTYILSPKDTSTEIYNQFKENKFPNNSKMVTFKEGIGFTKVIENITENTNITKEQIEAKLNDTNYLNSLIKEYWFLKDDILNENLYYPLEGYLFPDTYSIDKDDTIEEIFGRMLDRTEKELDKYEDALNKSKFSVHEVMTLASVVELEGSKESDRQKIASVFLNRLSKGMDLGSCVTTYYAVHKVMGEDELYNSDINTANPYNTRGPGMIGKLPVGPISNPSTVSIKAVLEPITTDYYYFVSDLSGNLYFTKTYDEHNAMISKLTKEGKF